MHTRPRIAVMLLVGGLLLSACNSASSAANITITPSPSASATPTSVPSPTPLPVFAAGSEIAGIDVSDLSLTEARDLLLEELPEPPEQIRLSVGDETLEIEGDILKFADPLDTLLEEAEPALAAGRAADVPLSLSYDETALQTQLVILAERVSVPAEIRVITATDEISRSFGYLPGRTLNVDEAIELVSKRIAENKLNTPIKLTLDEDDTVPQVSQEQILAEIEAMADEWDGVVGLRLIDLASGDEISLHDKTVFAGASTIKVAIMLNAYIHLEEFTERQEFWLGEMIRYSDNLSANDLLSAAAGSTGTEAAFEGAEQMSDMLANDLGIENTYLNIPYESTDYIRQNNIKLDCGPPNPVGEAPYTEMGACLRATPHEIAQIYLLIDQCAQGEGVLLEKFELLNAKRCQEMLDRLATNDDDTRMVAGLPEGTRVEHKSGWIEDMQADAGIVRSPNGDYILATYVYKELTGNRFNWPDELMAPTVAAFSRLVYSAYNPILLDEEPSNDTSD